MSIVQNNTTFSLPPAFMRAFSMSIMWDAIPHIVPCLAVYLRFFLKNPHFLAYPKYL